MQQKPLVSVIVPVYNTGEYLANCLESLLHQTLHNIEIICVDDGSTDNSLEILKSFASKDIRIKVLTQPHKKQGAARNLGMSIAQGSYIGFTDSDDWVDKDLFEQLYKKALATDSDITMSSLRLFDEKTQSFISDNSAFNLDMLPKSFFHDNRVFTPEETFDFIFQINVSPCCKIFKNSFLKKYNLLFPSDYYFEDNVFFMKAYLKAKRISALAYEGYNYTISSKTSTCYGNDKNKLDLFKMIREKEQVLKDNDVHKKLKNDFYYNKKEIILFLYKNIKDKNIKNKNIEALFLLQVLIHDMPVFFQIITTNINLRVKEILLLYKLKKLKNKTVVFWGASIFLSHFLQKYNIKNKNIKGIIDANPAKNGQTLCGYTIYPPEQLNTLNPDEIIISIINSTAKRKTNIQETINTIYKKKTVLTTV